MEITLAKMEEGKVILSDRLAEVSGGRILDVATECGWFISKLVDYFRDFEQVIGIDITDEDFDEAGERFKEEAVSFMVMDGAKLKFEAATFDTVSMAHGIHHLDDIQMVLAEMMRVLKPGGMLIVREGYRNVNDEKQITDVLQHDWYAEIDRLLGIPHFPTLKRQEIVEYIDKLKLIQLEMMIYQCDDCPRSRGETTEEEIIEMDEQLQKIKGLPQYSELKNRRDSIVDRIRSIGICCQPALDVVGYKPE